MKSSSTHQGVRPEGDVLEGVAASVTYEIDAPLFDEMLSRASALANLDLRACPTKLPRHLIDGAIQLFVDLLVELPRHLVLVRQDDVDSARGADARSLAYELDDGAAQLVPAIRALQDLLDGEFCLGGHAQDGRRPSTPNTTGVPSAPPSNSDFPSGASGRGDFEGGAEGFNGSPA